MLMECQTGLPHLGFMDSTAKPEIFDVNALLGKKASGRGAVDLLCEALRLNCTDAEIEELRRLYVGGVQHPSTKTPQSAR
jgi:hypothetical protein